MPHKSAAPRRREWRRGSVLVEAVAAMAMLAVIGVVLLKGSMNVLAPRHWTMVQNLSEAQLSFEKAFAERIEFTDLAATTSPWPVFPAKAEIQVTLGTLPGGKAITGKVLRTRIPDANNFPAYGGSGTISTNPSEMEVWKLQSHLAYKINGREYVKSRTVVRTR